MSTSPPPAPRRSGRERKQAEIFSSQPDASRKRKRGSEGPSEDEDEVERDEDRHDEDEEMEDPQQEGSEEEEQEEDYVAPRKSAARKAKASTSGTNGQAAETKKPRAPRAPKVPKPTVKPRRRKGKGDADADPKPLPRNAIMNPAAALQSTAEDFLDSYSRTPALALADLVNCILRCCGCNALVDSDQVLDTDGVVDCLEDLMEAMKKEPVLAYPLASKLPVFKKFRKSLSEFLSRLIVSAAETGALYDEQLVAILQTWVMAMSSANLRSFRHTTTVVALEVESALAEVTAAVDKEAEVLRRQREGEKKKTANKGKGREQDLQTKFDDVQHRKKHLKELMKEIFDAVFVLRYRDADPGIRAECVQEFGVWVEKYPAFFLESNHLRYIGWVLSDTNTQVRLAAVKSLYSLYKRDEHLVFTNHFTQRYKPRLVAMAASDVEVSVRVAVIQVLCAIDALGELEEDQTEQMELLIFDQEPRGGDAEKDRSRAGFKCLGSLLVKWAKKLEKDEEGDAVPDQTESQEGASESGAGGHKSKEVTALVSDLQSRIALCVDSLWDEVDAVSDWEDLIEFLLLDHSADGEDDVSPVASKKKRAAEANEKNGKGRRKSTVNEAEVDEAWRPEDSEEAALVEVLVASLKKTIGDAAEKKNGEADAVQADVTRALIKSLPQLFAKHQADERRISEVILIPQVMNLDLYAEMGLNKAYETLWDEVIKHFLSHSSPIVIRNANITVSRLLTTSSMFGENEAKMAQLEEELSTSLRGVVAERDDLDAAFLEDDEVHALSGFALRVKSMFRVRDLSGWMDNDEDGKQSSV
ncbi:hypothetical protein FRC04_009981 [Tulasnella sp. 424]|nr:hypothetical protein FRC04_009981 [Tulasnella sp. 424]